MKYLSLLISFLILINGNAHSSDSECIEHALGVNERYYKNTVEAVRSWNDYEDIAKIKNYLDGEIEFFLQCQSYYPTVVMTKDGMLFVRSNLQSVIGFLKSSLTDYKSIPKLDSYPEVKKDRAVKWFESHYNSTSYILEETLLELEAMNSGWENTPGYKGG
jgi:hypothetical protein